MVPVVKEVVVAAAFVKREDELFVVYIVLRRCPVEIVAAYQAAYAIFKHLMYVVWTSKRRSVWTQVS
nr:hypothetical protein [Tanacetum cinerariifolium]